MHDFDDLRTCRLENDEQYFAFIERIHEAIKQVEAHSVGPKPTKRMRMKVRMYDCALKAILLKYGYEEIDHKIIYWMVRGLSYARIGKNVSLSTSQVKKRALGIFKRAGVKDRTRFETAMRWSLFRLDEFLEFIDPADYGFDAEVCDEN